VTRSLRHILAGLPQLRHAQAVLSDGEHLGIPLALVMRLLGIRTRHIVIGHHLMTTAKTPFFRIGRVHRRMDRILVHSSNQVQVLAEHLRVPPSLIRVVPYGIDTDFWSPRPSDQEEDDLIASAGREHRDWETLVNACTSMARLCIADASQHSPQARRQEPAQWPATVERVALDYVQLRSLYARAAVVVIPLIPTSVPFGITSVLEAMAVGKPVVVSATEGMTEIVDDGETGVLVPPRDAGALAGAVGRLLADRTERRRLGLAARKKVVEDYGLDVYAEQLARQLEVVTVRNLSASQRSGGKR
jgi:glycosyltransferase involved in cell wall biosynthesis